MSKPLFELRQSFSWFTKNNIRVFDDRVEWDVCDGNVKGISSVRFEDIEFRHTEKIIQINSERRRFTLRLLMLFLSLFVFFIFSTPLDVAVVFLAPVPFLLIFYYRSPSSYFYYFDDKGTPLFMVMDNERNAKFMNWLRKYAGQSLRGRFGKITRILPLDVQAKRIQWLYERGHMHEDEYNRKMRALWKWRYEQDDDDGWMWGRGA